MEKGKLTLALLIALFVALVTIAIVNQRWVENSKNLAHRDASSKAMENRLDPQTPENEEEPETEIDHTEDEDQDDSEEETVDQEPITEITTVAEQEGIKPDTKTMYTTHGINVREDATTDSERIGFYNAETEVQVIGEVNNGWTQVDYNGQVGYVFGSYLTSKKPAPPIPSPPPVNPTQPREPSTNEPAKPSEPEVSEPDDQGEDPGAVEQNQDNHQDQEQNQNQEQDQEQDNTEIDEPENEETEQP